VAAGLRGDSDAPDEVPICGADTAFAVIDQDEIALLPRAAVNRPAPSARLSGVPPSRPIRIRRECNAVAGFVDRTCWPIGERRQEGDMSVETGV